MKKPEQSVPTPKTTTKKRKKPEIQPAPPAGLSERFRNPAWAARMIASLEGIDRCCNARAYEISELMMEANLKSSLDLSSRKRPYLRLVKGGV